MTIRYRLVILLIFVLSVLLTLYKVPLVSSQGLTVFVEWVDGDLPEDDLYADLWQRAVAVSVPLSAQKVSKPMLLESKIKSVNVRALQNATRLAFLVEWDDATRDDSIVRVQDFRDAVALQFPQATGQPFYCMGQQGGNVSIWHWKADWQADIAARQDMETLYPNIYVDQYPFAKQSAGVSAGPQDYEDANYLPALQAGNLFASAVHASPVENLVAGGFGTLTALPPEGQNVQGYGEWKDGKWRVIFSRTLASDIEGDVVFSPGKSYSVAFAVWDGANGERNGQKSTSQWIALQLSSPAKALAEQPAVAETNRLNTPENLSKIVILAVVLIIAAGALIYARLPD